MRATAASGERQGFVLANEPEGPVIDKVQPQKAIEMPCTPTLSEPMSIGYPSSSTRHDVLNALKRSRVRAHMASSTRVRVFLLVSVEDFFYLTSEAVLTRSKSKN